MSSSCKKVEATGVIHVKQLYDAKLLYLVQNPLRRESFVSSSLTSSQTYIEESELFTLLLRVEACRCYLELENTHVGLYKLHVRQNLTRTIPGRRSLHFCFCHLCPRFQDEIEHEAVGVRACGVDAFSCPERIVFIYMAGRKYPNFKRGSVVEVSDVEISRLSSAVFSENTRQRRLCCSLAFVLSTHREEEI